jgi:hypothetical protein
VAISTNCDWPECTKSNHTGFDTNKLLAKARDNWWKFTLLHPPSKRCSSDHYINSNEEKKKLRRTANLLLDWQKDVKVVDIK